MKADLLCPVLWEWADQPCEGGYPHMCTVPSKELHWNHLCHCGATKSDPLPGGEW